MRFRNIMWDSGTPFCMSSSIAWLAEFPRKATRLDRLIALYISRKVKKKDKEQLIRTNMEL